MNRLIDAVSGRSARFNGLRYLELFPWDLFAFGFRRNGNVITIRAGVIYLGNDTVTVTGGDVTLTGGLTEWVYVEHTLGASTGSLQHQTSRPVPSNNLMKWPLQSWTLVSASRYRLAGIQHIGDIFLHAPIAA